MVDTSDFYSVVSYLRNHLFDKKLILNLYFTEKNKNKYTSYSPNSTNDLKRAIASLIIEEISKLKIESTHPYNAIGCLDHEVEIACSSEIGGFNELIHSFDEVITILHGIEPEKITFYTLHCWIRAEGIGEQHHVYFFRRVNKLKRLNKHGIIATFTQNMLDSLDSKVLGIDGDVDIIVFDDTMFIINHYALERIFQVKDQFIQKTNEALDRLEQKRRIKNFKEFRDACLSDMRIEKSLTKLLASPYILEHTLDDIEQVKNAINRMGWDIDIEGTNNDWQIVYNPEDSTKLDLMNIIYLIKDSCYESFILKRVNIDKLN